MANSNNWGEIYKSTWWGDEDWSANSLKIDSAPPGFAFTALLDTYTGAAAAYSVRKLSSTYSGSALRVRKEVSSVDEETDIGFNASNELDTAALLSFASDADGGNVYVSIWYDQSGNGNNATNSTASEQPLVVSGGTLVTETNGLAAISWESNDLAFLQIPWNATSSQSWFGTFNPLNDSFVAITETAGTSDRDWVAQNGSTSTSIEGFDNNPNLYVNGSLQSLTTRDDVHNALSVNGNIIYATIDLDISGWSDASNWYFFGHGGGVSNTFNYSGRVQEWIVFESDQSSNRTGIETNINDHFDIYTP